MMSAKQNVKRKAVRALHVLARGARIIDRVAARGHLLQRLLQERQRRALRDRRRAGDGRGVELLEVVDRLRNRLALEVRDGAELHQRAIGRAQVQIEHLFGVQPVLLQHLRNDLVGAAGDREVIDITAAHGRAEHRGHVLLGEAELRPPCHDRPRWSAAASRSSGRRIDEPEEPARLGAIQHLLLHLVETLDRLAAS